MERDVLALHGRGFVLAQPVGRQASDYGEERAAVAARMDLDDYLRRTGHIEIPAHERLRQLAIEMERHYGFAPEVLDRIYEAGIRLEPKDHLL